MELTDKEKELLDDTLQERAGQEPTSQTPPEPTSEEAQDLSVAEEPSGGEEEHVWDDRLKGRAESYGLDLSHYSDPSQLEAHLEAFDRMFLAEARARQTPQPTQYQQGQQRQPAEKPKREPIKLDLSGYDIDEDLAKQLNSAFNQAANYYSDRIEQLEQSLGYMYHLSQQEQQQAIQAKQLADFTEFDQAVDALGAPELFGKGGYHSLPQGSVYRRNREQLWSDAHLLAQSHQARGMAAPAMRDLPQTVSRISFHDYYKNRKSPPASERAKRTHSLRTSGGSRSKANRPWRGDLANHPELVEAWNQIQKDNGEQ